MSEQKSSSIEPTLIIERIFETPRERVFEAWTGQDKLEAHFKAPHMAAWRASWPQFGVSDRKLFAYEVASQREV